MSTSLRALLRRLGATYTLCQSTTTVLLLAFIIGSLLFTGGRVTPDEDIKWGELWSWPVFSVPPWATVIPAALGALVVVPIAVTSARSDDNPVIGLWGQTVPALGGAFAFNQLFPVASGTPLFWSHAFAMALSGFSWVVLSVAVVVLLVRERRLRGGEAEAPVPMMSRARLIFGCLLAIACAGLFAVIAWGSIQGWRWIAAQAKTGGAPRTTTSDPPTVAGMIVLSLTAAGCLLATVVVVRSIVRQVAAGRRSRDGHAAH